LQDSSPRRKEVLNEEEKMRGRMEREGKTVSDNARLKQAAARNNRRSKNFDHGKMQERALEMDAKHDYQARRLWPKRGRDCRSACPKTRLKNALRKQ
jgi:hypothetical protein